MGPLRDKVVGPDVMPIRGASSHAGPISQPQPPALRLFLGHFQPFPPPQPLHALVIHEPALPTQQPCNPPIAIPAIHRRQLDHPIHQPRFIRRHGARVPVRRPRVADHATGPPLRDRPLAADARHRLPASGRAQKFPEATSLENHAVERLVRDQLLQPPILPLKLLQPLRLVEA